MRGLAGAWICLAACNLAYPADVGPDAAPDASPNLIIGHSLVTHVLLDGSVVTRNEDLTGYKVQAYVPDASVAAGYDIIDGTSDANGTVTIDHVPPGVTYALALTPPISADNPTPSPSFFFTSERSLDLGYAALGRPQSVAVSATTPVTLNMTNMTPWLDGDDTLWVDSIATDTEHQVVGADATTNGPVQGATSLSGLTFDWRDPNIAAPPGPPHEVELGDDVIADHVRFTASTLYDATIGSIVDHGSLSGVVVHGGAPSSASGAFDPVPMSSSQSFRFDIPSLENAASCAGGAGAEDVRFQLIANPAGAYGIATSPALLDARASMFPHNRTGFEMDGLAYGDPYPSTWPHVVAASFECWRMNVVDVDAAFQVSSMVELVEGASTLDEIPGGSAAFISAPVNATVGGLRGDRGGTISFDGTHSFTVSWDAVDGATSYEVRIVHAYFAKGPGFVEDLVATFHTTDTAVIVPPSLLEPGRLYAFLVGAHRDAGGYASGALRRSSFPRGTAFAATAQIRMSNLCGNHAVDGGEACDDGADSAVCDADCTKAACGDGYVNAAAGEQCDWGAPGPCDSDCTPVMCGDGNWNQAFEACDDGNTKDDGNGCSATCALDKCGDGSIQGPWETCDDGNKASGDGCSGWCQVEPDWQCAGSPSQCQHN